MLDWVRHTAERCDWGVDWLDKNTFTVELYAWSVTAASIGLASAVTSSHDFASSRIHPSSITSAESFVTYTPCSSHVVATWMTRYRSRLGAAGLGVGWLAIITIVQVED
jgi:hypothetical protein